MPSRAASCFCVSARYALSSRSWRAQAAASALLSLNGPRSDWPGVDGIKGLLAKLRSIRPSNFAKCGQAEFSAWDWLCFYAIRGIGPLKDTIPAKRCLQARPPGQNVFGERHMTSVQPGQVWEMYSSD